MRERWYANLRQIRNEEFLHTTWYPIEPIKRLIVHDHRCALGTEAHVKLHPVELFCSCDECGQAVLTDRRVVGPSVREKEWAPECFTCATDRA